MSDALQELEAEMDQLVKARGEIEQTYVIGKNTKDANPKFIAALKAAVAQKGIEIQQLESKIARTAKKENLRQAIEMAKASQQAKAKLAELSTAEALDFNKNFKVAAKAMLPEDLYMKIIYAAKEMAA